jgi:putative membrane protein
MPRGCVLIVSGSSELGLPIAIHLLYYFVTLLIFESVTWRLDMYNWNNWYTGWGWFLWFGIFALFFSSLGNWSYTYRAHRLYRDGVFNKDAIDFLNERYARGEVNRVEFNQIKNEIMESSNVSDNRRIKNHQENLQSIF